MSQSYAKVYEFTMETELICAFSDKAFQLGFQVGVEYIPPQLHYNFYL